MARQTIAIVGAGVAGVTAAHLLDSCFDVTLFERNDYIGGHTNTIDVTEGPDAGCAVDSGFIVLNDRTYPRLHRLLKRLGVNVRPAEMSFSYFCQQQRNGYASRGLNTLFAYRRNIFNPRYLRFLGEVLRFWRQSVIDLDRGELDSLSVAQYLERKKFSRYFFDNYLAPFAGAIWSAPDQGVRDFPVELLVRFFKNHGMLSYSEQPQWQTVIGGSREYIRAFERSFGGTIVKRAAVSVIEKSVSGVVIRMADSRTASFDRAIIATHADEALQLLGNPSSLQRELLGVWRYQSNDVIVHSDISLLPPNRRLWAAWNYCRYTGDDPLLPVSVTYSMNILQGLRTQRHYCVSLNPRCKIAEEAVIRRLVYDHPIFDFAALKSQTELSQLNTDDRLKFCGSYFGYGFHEDGVKAACDAVESFGVSL